MSYSPWGRKVSDTADQRTRGVLISGMGNPGDLEDGK